MTDKVKSGDVVIVYHPTKEMVSDYLTKPLNGILIKSHRNTIMGLTEESNAYYKIQSILILKVYTIMMMLMLMLMLLMLLCA